MNAELSYCGYVAIIGRPNVGKSTLLNHLVGEKISITSRKAQTTRHQILGIDTQGNRQIIYVDTPGIHTGQKRALNRYMNRVASHVLLDVDIVVWVVDARGWTEADDIVLDKLSKVTTPVILAMNKIDRCKDKSMLLPHIASCNEKMAFAELVPISAKTGANLANLQQAISQRLPQAAHLFLPDDMTDRSMRFLAGEMVREKLFRLLGQELPYVTTVVIEKFELKDNVYHIAALILVEKASQKRMLIGKQGGKLKQVGTQARVDMEKLLEQKVFLQLWVKVKTGWGDDERLLGELGYGE